MLRDSKKLPDYLQEYRKNYTFAAKLMIKPYGNTVKPGNMTAKSITTKAGQSKVANSLYKAVSEKVAIFTARNYGYEVQLEQMANNKVIYVSTPDFTMMTGPVLEAVQDCCKPYLRKYINVHFAIGVRPLSRFDERGETVWLYTPRIEIYVGIEK